MKPLNSAREYPLRRQSWRDKGQQETETKWGKIAEQQFKQDKRRFYSLFAFMNVTRGTGNNNTEWLQEIKQAISRKVQSTADQDWMLETEVLVKVVLKKRNFSAPGPERLVNFWWKQARCHEAIMRAFKAISEVNEAYPLWFAKGKIRLIPKQKTV